MNKPQGSGSGHDPRHLDEAEEAWLTHGLKESLSAPAAAPEPSRGRRLFAAAAVLLGVAIVGVVLLDRGPAEEGGTEGGVATAKPVLDPSSEGDDGGPQDPILTIDPAPPPPLTVVPVRSADELDRWLPQVIRIDMWRTIGVRLGGGTALAFHPASACVGFVVDDVQIAQACASLSDVVRTLPQSPSTGRSFEFALQLGGNRQVRGVIDAGSPRLLTFEFGAEQLGPFAVPTPLLEALQSAMDEATAAADIGFAVTTGPTLEGVPRTLRHLVTYGLGDAALDSLFEFEQLEALHIYGYSADAALDPVTILVTDGFARELPPLPHLRSVQLTGTATTGAVFRALGRLPALEELIVDEAGHGDYRGAAFDGLHGCYSLRTLRLRGLTRFDQATVDSLAEIPILEELELDVVANRQLGEFLGELVHKSPVERLHLRGLDLPDDWLALPPKSKRSLHWLHVADGHLDLAGLQGHAKLHEVVLERVTLAQRAGRGLGPMGFTKVHTMALRGMRGFVPSELTHLPPSLRHLELRDCGVTTAHLDIVGPLSHLETLDLRDNGLTSAQVEYSLKGAFAGKLVIN